MLVLTLLFGAVWFVALRPSAVEPEPAPPAAQPGESSIPGPSGDALDNAREGAGRADQDNAGRSDRVEGAAGGTPGPSGGAAPGSAPRTPSRPARAPGEIQVTGGGVAPGASPAAVQRALAARKVVVVLFYGGGADDSAMKAELAQVSRRGGRVQVFRASISRVSRFGALTRGIKVLEAPTVVVAGPIGRGRALTGYTDATEIDQAVHSVLPRRRAR